MRIQYRLVFASGQTAASPRDADGNLHTNFTLRRGGGYLALVAPDNTILSQYGTSQEDYPEQLANVSYGMAQSLSLITLDSSASYWVPVHDDLGTS